MGRDSIQARITAGRQDLTDILDWIEAYAAHHRDDQGRQVWEVTQRDEPEYIGRLGPLMQSRISLYKL